jgi:PAS domain S-box-containing protein
MKHGAKTTLGAAVGPPYVHSIAERATDFIFVIDSSFAVRFVNAFAASYLKLPPEKIVGKPLKEFFPPAVYAEQKRGLLKVFRSGRPYSYEEKFIFPNRELWVDTKLSPLTDKDGAVTAVLGISRDITDRKEVVDLIACAKKEWERTVDSMADLIAVIDSKYRIVRVNKAMANRMGVTVKKAVGMKCYENFYAGRKPPPFCPLVQTTAAERRQGVDLYERHWGGNYLLSVSPIIDAEGRLTGCTYVGRNIERHEKAEETQRKSREQMKLLMKNSEYVILIQDLNGKYMFFNAAPQSSLEPEDVLGKTPFDFFDPLIASKMSERVQQVADSQQGVTHMNHLTWNGEVLSFFDQISPVRDVIGNITAVATISRKITERKREVHEAGLFDSDGCGLTRRESEILRLIASGLTSRQIADKLFISQKTVETHRSRLMQKLDLHKAADLVKFAVKSGLL